MITSIFALAAIVSSSCSHQESSKYIGHWKKIGAQNESLDIKLDSGKITADINNGNNKSRINTVLAEDGRLLFEIKDGIYIIVKKYEKQKNYIEVGDNKYLLSGR